MFDKLNLGGDSVDYHIYRDGQILPVLPAKTLISSNKHRMVLSQLETMLALPGEHYQYLYDQLLLNFADFVQVLPTSRTSPLSSLLNEGLGRAITSLSIIQQEAALDLDPRRTYAVFTAALLQDIAKVIIDRKVMLCNEEGEYVADWQPLDGVMSKAGMHYKIREYVSGHHRIHHLMAPLLAYQLIPRIGFLWIAQDNALFVDWMHALGGGDDSGGGIRSILSKIPLANNVTLPSVKIDPVEANGVDHGEAFLRWLREGLLDGSLPVNTADSGVHVVEGGVLLEFPMVFKAFIERYNVHATIFQIYHQAANALGVRRSHGSDFIHDEFFSEYPEVAVKGESRRAKSVGSSPFSRPETAKRYGLLVKEAGLVFPAGFDVPEATSKLRSVVPVNTDVSSKLPSLEHLIASAEKLSTTSGPRTKN